MEKRRLGRTDMDVTVLGFGGAGTAGEDRRKDREGAEQRARRRH